MVKDDSVFDSYRDRDWETRANVTVTMGLHSPSEREFRIAEAFLQDDYSRSTFNSDLMLLKLSERVEFTSNIQPVCLPSEPIDLNAECYITGTGHLGMLRNCLLVLFGLMVGIGTENRIAIYCDL